MRKLIVIAALLALAGCGGPPMSNENIIAKSQQCKTAGLLAVEFRNWEGEIASIQCANHIYH